jgi:Proline dehydrogenase
MMRESVLMRIRNVDHTHSVSPTRSIVLHVSLLVLLISLSQLQGSLFHSRRWCVSRVLCCVSWVVGFFFAGKLVRGAYMVLERERAARNGYEDPIMPSLTHTHQNYDRVCTWRGYSSVCVGKE